MRIPRVGGEIHQWRGLRCVCPFTLIPTDVTGKKRWFETAILGRSLDREDRFGLMSELRDVQLDDLQESAEGLGLQMDAAAAPQAARRKLSANARPGAAA